ncbi:hypothetical protein KFZ76_13120 [Methylovulum psychrotolerans]|uniref:hypothetical protein n=1 Tax=Methylovulum psychrotolerans TaxID=1704499 RepID=UPI001BFF3382|nr:hypothetical protein [Methylovulum psychrotolerans]MBT9098643.1 hypothetical protein [Methylovulum psychrotolerans]
MIDMKKRRRQVTWQCFTPHLNEAQLIKTIQILEQNFQNDSVSSLIAYITHICTEFNLDTTVRKSLYGQFHELMAENNTLPDPLLSLQQPSTGTAVAPAESTPEDNAITSPAPSAEPDSTALPNDISVQAWMFEYFASQLLANLPDPMDFFDALWELSINKTTTSRETEEQIAQWLNNTNSFLWAIGLTEQNFAEIAQLMCTALCEALGAAHAGQHIQNTLEKCEQTPQARHFSPKNFF